MVSKWTKSDAPVATIVDSIPTHHAEVFNIAPLSIQQDARVEALLTDLSSNAIQTVTHHSALRSGLSSNELRWIQSIDYKAVEMESVFNRNEASNVASGTSYSAKWASTSETGLIAVAGLDQSSAVHLFLSLADKQGYFAGGQMALIPSSVAWVRLWKDKIVIDKQIRILISSVFQKMAHCLQLHLPQRIG